MKEANATSEQCCIQALELAAHKIGRDSFTVGEYNDLEIVPSSQTIKAKFGGWNRAKEQAGLETNPSPKRLDQRGQYQTYSYADCVKAVREVDERHEFKDMTQSIYDRQRDESHPSSATVSDRLGGFPEIRETIL